MESEQTRNKPRYGIDPYLDWVQSGRPAGRPRTTASICSRSRPRRGRAIGVKGAAVHLKGRGDFANMFVFEIPPGGSTTPQRHLYEDVVYVLEGTGSTQLEFADGTQAQLRMGPAQPVRDPAQRQAPPFQRQRPRARAAGHHHRPAAGDEHLPQRAISSSTPISSSPSAPARSEYYSGEGDLVTVRPGNHMWETNFVPDLDQHRAASLGRPRRRRRPTSCSCSPTASCTRTSRRCRSAPTRRAIATAPALPRDVRRRPGLSRCSGSTARRISRASTGSTASCSRRPTSSSTSTSTPATSPARYLATGVGGLRYPLTAIEAPLALAATPGDKSAVSISVKEGGDQIEYEDQDPRIHPHVARGDAQERRDAEDGEIFSGCATHRGGVKSLQPLSGKASDSHRLDPKIRAARCTSGRGVL